MQLGISRRFKALGFLGLGILILRWGDKDKVLAQKAEEFRLQDWFGAIIGLYIGVIYGWRKRKWKLL